MLTEAPVIDYDAHPAFAGLAAQCKSDVRGENLATEIEDAYTALIAGHDTQQIRTARFDSEIMPRLRALHDHLARQVRPQFVAFLDKAMLEAERVLRDDLTARDVQAAMRNDTGELKGIFSDALARFRAEGYFEFGQAALARRVWAATRIERLILRIKEKKTPNRHCVLALHPKSPAFRMIERMAYDSGLVDFVSAFTGKKMEFSYAALDHAHPGQVWHKDCYADMGLPTSKTVYMHTDADFGIIKAMFYLRDVGPGDGPFRFVAGSHAWKRSPLTLAVQKGFDEAATQIDLQKPDSRGYYRPRFSLPELRPDILAMPPRLRGSTHFGDDILDGSALSDALLEAERSFISPGGTMVLFDGSRGIHRGGQVEPGGNRWAVQIGFRVRKSPQPQESILRAMKRSAGYYKDLIQKFAAAAGGR